MTIQSSALPSQPIRVGVVGVGIMGQNHLRVYDGLKDVQLVGIFDPDIETAQKAANMFSCDVYKSLADLSNKIDAASICSPSNTHHESGVDLLGKGIHCLIEKPLAVTQKECSDLTRIAKKGNAKLLVGHIERFNPAVQQVFKLLQQGAKIQAIEAHRLSSASSRIEDVDVVLDLMIHDLDIVLTLANSPVKKVSATQVQTNPSRRGDHVTAILDFENGISATLIASRISQKPVRRLSVMTDQGTVDIDYRNQSADVYLKSSIIHSYGEEPFGQYASGITMESVQIRRQEPLQLELSHFIDIIKKNEDPFITSQQAQTALEVVWHIQHVLKGSS